MTKAAVIITQPDGTRSFVWVDDIQQIDANPDTSKGCVVRFNQPFREPIETSAPLENIVAKIEELTSPNYQPDREEDT